MKNIAILVSGVSRNATESYNNLKETIVDPLINLNYNVKIFVHTWKTGTVIDQKWNVNSNIDFEEDDFKGSKQWYQNNTNLDVKKHIESIVEVESLIRENQAIYENKFFKLIDQLPTPQMKTPFNLISFLYSRYKSSTLMNEYEEKTNSKFDIVIRHRTEALLNNQITDDIITLARTKTIIPKFYINRFPDLTTISNRQHSETLNNIYHNILDLIKNEAEFNPHKLMKNALNFYNIPYEITHEIKTKKFK